MKTKKQLEAELSEAHKRIADLTDALIKAVQAQTVIVTYVVPVAQPTFPPYADPFLWWGGGTWCAGTIDVAIDATPVNVALNAPVQS